MVRGRGGDLCNQLKCQCQQGLCAKEWHGVSGAFHPTQRSELGVTVAVEGQESKMAASLLLLLLALLDNNNQKEHAAR